MNRFLQRGLWCLLFAGIVLGGDRIGGAALSKLMEGADFRYSRLYTERAGGKILIAGNSRGLSFFEPHIAEATGYSTTNLSYNGLPLVVASVLLQDHIDQYGNPEVLLLEVSMLDARMSESLLPAFTAYARHSPRLTKLLRDRCPKDFYASELSHLYRYNSQVFQRALHHRNRSDKDWLATNPLSAELQESVAEWKLEFAIDPEAIEALSELSKYCRRKGVRLELVTAPYYPPFVDNLANLSELQNAAGQAAGLPVRDFSLEVKGPENFADYQHLNQAGARKFVEALIAENVLPVSTE